MQQNLASRSNKYSYYFFLSIFSRDYPAPWRPIFASRSAPSESENRHSSPPFALLASLFRKSQIRREEYSLGRSTRYVTFVAPLRASRRAGVVPSMPKIVRLLQGVLGDHSNFTRQTVGMSSRRKLNVSFPNDEININNEKFARIFFFLFSFDGPAHPASFFADATLPRETGQRNCWDTLAEDTAGRGSRIISRGSESLAADLCRAHAGRKSADATSVFSTRSRVSSLCSDRVALLSGNATSRQLTR